MLSDEQSKVQTSQTVADALEALEQKPFDVYVKARASSGVTQRSQTSTRRFFSRPSSVLLEAIGNSFPNPFTTAGFMPRICN